MTLLDCATPEIGVGVAANSAQLRSVSYLRVLFSRSGQFCRRFFLAASYSDEREDNCFSAPIILPQILVCQKICSLSESFLRKKTKAQFGT